MKTLLNALLCLLLSGPLALQSTLAHAHGDSGGGGGGGNDTGGDTGGGGIDRVGSNSEKTSQPSGFSKSKSTVARAFKVKAAAIPALQLQVLQAQGYVDEADQRESGDRDWKGRASQKSQTQWEKHQSTAYDIAVEKGGVSLADVNALAANQPNVNVSATIADQAWSMASGQRNSAGDGMTSGLGGQTSTNPQFDAKRTASVLPNFAPPK